jgi:hypothetical protein
MSTYWIVRIQKYNQLYVLHYITAISNVSLAKKISFYQESVNIYCRLIPAAIYPLFCLPYWKGRQVAQIFQFYGCVLGTNCLKSSLD